MKYDVWLHAGRHADSIARELQNLAVPVRLVKKVSGNGPVTADCLLAVPGSTGEITEILACGGDHGLPVIILARQADAATAVEALTMGAADFLTMPLDRERLLKALERAVGPAEAPGRRRRSGPLAAIIGESPVMEEVFSLIEKVCDTDTTVLIQGESGTGKELIAQALHAGGARGKGPFIPVNCGAIPGELLESELFGHEKGAFTHAVNTRIGRFELADGGTVFLDEISEMSPMLQVKLLRVLQEKKFERVGGTRTISSDFRVVAATNRELEEEVAAGRFREDLFYRLNVIPIKAPPLRERGEDILLLAEHFIRKFERLKRKKVRGLSPEVRQILLRYPWPGNVRELENIMERMVILTSGEILDVDDLPEKMRRAGAASSSAAGDNCSMVEGIFSLAAEVAAYEKQLIIQALNQTDWVKNRAARLLGLNRTTLVEKMKRHQLEKPQVRLED